MLALANHGTRLAFAVADPWRLRSAGQIACRKRARRASCLRLVRREKPTALVTADPSLTPVLRRVAFRTGVGLVEGPLPALHRCIARDLYPELPLYAPTRTLESVACVAIAAVLHAHTTVRRYRSRRGKSHVRATGGAPAR